ncbi:MAG: hypothetical protein IKM59_06360 [Oscillospiraceae bacterium]|nr:hypothetical protein [Oscillospiraceae bacterium]
MAMKEKELKSLSRGDILELLLAQTERVEQLEKELEEANARAEARDIMIEKSGTLAEAAMEINRVWQAADQAAAQYLGNVMRIYDEQLAKNAQLERDYAKRSETLLGETTRKCREMEEATAQKCREMEAESTLKCQMMERETTTRCEDMTRKAETDSKAYWDQVYSKLEAYCNAQESLKSLLRMKG